jgi:hypothetical protein
LEDEMDTNHASRPRRRDKTVAAATLAAAALSIGGSVAFTAATNEQPAAGEWDRCVEVVKGIIYSRDEHSAFLC